jgi:hypothetical protein
MHPSLLWSKKKASPEEMKKGMEPWMVWANKIGDGLVEMGSPLGNGQLIDKTGNSPWAEGCKIEVFESMPMPE